MSVKQFLRMMPQIDRRYLDEAYRITAGRTTAKERGGIMKKAAKIAVAAALCVGVIAGGTALIWKLNSGGKPDVSPNPHGSGYVGNAPETVKFHAKLTKQPAEPSTQDVTWAAINAARLPGLDAIAYNKVYESNMQLSLSDKGRYIYSVGAKPSAEDVSVRAGGIFVESIISVDFALNTVCIKCFSGMANAACAAIDSMKWNGVVGTIAGDDTIFVLCRDESAAEIFTANLEKTLNVKNA